MSFEEEFKFETLEEIQDNLNQLFDLITQLEIGNPICSVFDELFRHIHSMKGNSNSAEFNDFSKAAHKLEDVLIAFKNKEIEYGEPFLKMLITGHSCFQDALEILKKDMTASTDYSALYEALEKVKETGSGVASSHRSGLRFLIIDDEEDIADMISDEISDFYDQAYIQKACNGLEAIAICQNDPFDVILTDYNMPEMNGEEFVSRLRYSGDLNSNVPILMITGFKPNYKSDEKTWENVFFLEKPVSSNKIIFQIRCALNLKKVA